MSDAALEGDDAPASANGVQVIARVAQLFRALDGEPWGLTLTELAKQLRLPRSTVHRLVGALVAEGLLVSASTAGRVRIGTEFVRIATASRLELRQQVEPLMREMFERVGETVDCTLLEGDQLRVIEVIPTQHHLRAFADVGAIFPLHCSSKGKAILAELDDAQVEELLPRTLERFTPTTKTTRTALLAELAEVRRTGIAFDEEEYTPGIMAAAIASRDPFGSYFAISIPVPTQRFAESRDAIVETLLEGRAELNRTFGSVLN
jgi:DNA-binding IclR family transcriptional regulator